MLDTYSSVNMGSPKGRESYGDGVPTVIVGETANDGPQGEGAQAMNEKEP